MLWLLPELASPKAVALTIGAVATSACKASCKPSLLKSPPATPAASVAGLKPSKSVTKLMLVVSLAGLLNELLPAASCKLALKLTARLSGKLLALIWMLTLPTAIWSAVRISGSVIEVAKLPLPSRSASKRNCAPTSASAGSCTIKLGLRILVL